MPYNNLPQSMWGLMDKCVEEVQGKGHDKESAIAICHESVTKGKEVSILPDGVTMDEMLRIARAIMDAPEATDKAVNNPRRGGSVSVNPRSGGAQGSNEDTLQERCFLHMKKLLGDETQARKICHDAAGMMGAKEVTEITTIKQSDGHYRWILFSSSSYLDRDNEIVSQKALEADTERMNTTKEYGTLDWWHTPLVLGDCDFSAMHGRISIESGTFRDDWVGERFATMKGLGASRTFYNPVNEPDAQGVYHNIRTFSRAILPAERASNRLTLVDVSAKETKEVLQEKVKELITRLGGDKQAEAKVTELLQAAETTDKAAQDAGLTAKETAPEAKPEPEPTEPKVVFVGDMTMAEFEGKLTQAVEKFLTPAVKEIGEQVRKLSDAQATTQKETGDKLASSIKSVQDMQTDLAARLAALEGLTPRAYRPTQDPGTVVAKETAKERGPKGDAQAEATLGDWLAATK